MKVISSKVVAEKHIKSTLCGKDGTIINSIAFNAKDELLDTLLKKDNKRKFNVAGKMTLNEWHGKKNIEFIIEDIALN